MSRGSSDVTVSGPFARSDADGTQHGGGNAGPGRWHEDTPSTWAQRAIAAGIVVLPAVAVIVGVVAGELAPRTADVWLMVGGFAAVGVGISVGFHRYFTHRTFDTFPAVAFALGVLGSMAWQGPVMEWAAVHRRHHKHSDHEDDPHSPHLAGSGVGGLLRGALFAHAGWMFKVNIRTPEMERYVPDLRRSVVVMTLSRWYAVVAVCGLIAPGLVALAVEPTLESVGLGILWGGIGRSFALNHVTWCVNSVCHLWGRRDHDTSDQSRNNWIFGILALGEGWHNNHHAHPASARLGLRWWQVDAGWYVIMLMQACGLAWNVRQPGRVSGGVRRLPSAEH